MALQQLNWRAHLFVVGGAGGEAERLAQELLGIGKAHLERHGFANLHVHSSIHLGERTEYAVWAPLVDCLTQFQQEAHSLLSEARLHFAPILAPTSDVSLEEARSAAEFFRARLAIPSFYLKGDILGDLWRQATDGDARFFVDPASVGLPGSLWRSHVFESVLERVEEDVVEIVIPCRDHLVVDSVTGRVHSCFYLWNQAAPGVGIRSQGTEHVDLPVLPDGSDCLMCMAKSTLAMRENLEANSRQAEGRKVHFKLSLEAAGSGDLALAADLADGAFQLARTDADRTAALIQQALCLKELRQLEEADGVLAKAAEFTEDKGQIAYHRGRVQFVWRDYIEALEWFEEALESESNEVPIEDMCFEMALCHINIEEYPEARPYLDRSSKPGEIKAPIVFYRGVCDYGEGRYEEAERLFREALAAGPAPEDLARVVYYVGACLKELERFVEAAEVLQEAVAADPEDIANHNLLGFCYYKLKRHEEAVACFLRAVEIDPRSGIDWANLASNLRDLGRTKEAIAMYKKALSIDPSIGFARENLNKLAE